jgi:hypothetical protein
MGCTNLNFCKPLKVSISFKKDMIGKGYLSMLFILTTIVVLSHLSVNAQTVPSIPTIPSDISNATGEAMNSTANATGEAMNSTANATGEAMITLSNATTNAT